MFVAPRCPRIERRSVEFHISPRKIAPGAGLAFLG
jgi:hypothetical protein